MISYEFLIFRFCKVVNLGGPLIIYEAGSYPLGLKPLIYRYEAWFNPPLWPNVLPFDGLEFYEKSFLEGNTSPACPTAGYIVIFFFL